MGGLNPDVAQTTKGVARLSVPYDDVVRMIRTFAATIAENKEYLTELDSAIGDADHGINMDRGFQAVLAKLDALPPGDVGTLFKTVGMTLVSTVGGAGGPLYGTLFLQLGTATAGQGRDRRARTGRRRSRPPSRACRLEARRSCRTRPWSTRSRRLATRSPRRSSDGASFADALRRSAAAGEDGHEGHDPTRGPQGHGRATWESAAPDTKTPAPRRRSCC